MIEYHFRQGALNNVEILLNEMQRLKLSPDVVNCNTLLDGYCKNNAIDRAIEIVKARGAENTNNVITADEVENED